MLSWFKKLFASKPSARPEGPRLSATWLRGADSPFGMDVLDCREACGSTRSASSDQEVAVGFLALRSSDGRQHRGRLPEGAWSAVCDLSFPYHGERRDGTVFGADEMEDKWDIHLYGDRLYFSRSWTGVLVYVAAAAFDPNSVRLTTIWVAGGLDRDATYHVAVVDYLVKSHLFRMRAPHPFPRDLRNDPGMLALFSFSQYGRRAAYGSYGDTTRIRIPEPTGSSPGEA